jgi:hypothetical protein
MFAAGVVVRIQVMVAFIDQHATDSVSRSARRAFSAGTSRRRQAPTSGSGSCSARSSRRFVRAVTRRDLVHHRLSKSGLAGWLRYSGRPSIRSDELRGSLVNDRVKSAIFGKSRRIQQLRGVRHTARGLPSPCRPRSFRMSPPRATRCLGGYLSMHASLCSQGRARASTPGAGRIHPSGSACSR